MKYKQGFSEFFIDGKNFKKATAALRDHVIELCNSQNPPPGMSYFKRVLRDDETDYADFESYMMGFGWSLRTQIGINGYIGIAYEPIGFVSGDDSLEVLNIIAPYIKAGSYIEMSDSESRWRHYFDGSRCIKEVPEITWIPAQEPDYEKE